MTDIEIKNLNNCLMVQSIDVHSQGSIEEEVKAFHGRNPDLLRKLNKLGS